MLTLPTFSFLSASTGSSLLTLTLEEDGISLILLTNVQPWDPEAKLKKKVLSDWT